MLSPRQFIGVKTWSDNSPPERTPHCRCKQSTQQRITFHKPYQQIVLTSASKAKHWPKDSRVPVNLQTLQHPQTHLCRNHENGKEHLNHESRQTNPPKQERHMNRKSLYQISTTKDFRFPTETKKHSPWRTTTEENKTRQDNKRRNARRSI